MIAASSRWLRLAWYATALVIVLAAVAVTALRVALPRVESLRPAVARWIGERIGADVSIGRLEAGWHRGAPVLVAHDLRVRAAAEDVLAFARADAGMDAWHSVRDGALRLGHLTLRGLALHAERRADGTFAVAGLPAEDTRFMQWLLAQPDVRVADAIVTVRDARARFAPVTLRGVHLALSASAGASVIEGGAKHVDAVDGALEFRVQLPRRAAGDPVRGWLRGQALDITALFARAGLAPGAVVAVRGDVAVHAVQTPDTHLRLGFELAHVATGDGTRAPLGLRGAVIGTDSGFDVQVTRFGVAPDAWREVDWRGRFTTGAAPRLVASADEVPLDLLPLLHPWLPEVSSRRRVPHAARGVLRDLRVGWARRPDTSPGFYVRGAAEDLGWEGATDAPGLDRIRGTFVANGAAVVLALSDGALAYADPARVRAPLNLEMLAGRLHWQRLAHDDLRLALNGRAEANGIPVHVRGAITRTPGGDVADLDVALGTGDVAQVATLLPRHVMTERGEAWLDGAFRRGIFRGGRALLRGPLTAFPFDHDEGTFAATLAVDDAEFRYSARWPAAQRVSGQVWFAGRRLHGILTRATFADSPLIGARFEIADYLVPTRLLTVDGSIDATLADIRATLRDSPLAKWTSGELADVTLSGRTRLSLSLGLGLQTDGERRIGGAFEFDGNTLASARHRVHLEDLRGAVAFTREDWTAEDLTARLGGQRVTLDARGGLGARRYDNEFHLAGDATAAQVLEHLQHRVPALHAWLAANDRLSAVVGELAWRADVIAPHPAPGEPAEAPRLVLESNLEGLGVGLPWPFGKVALERRPLRIETTLAAEAAGTVQVRVGDDVRIAFRRRASDGDRPRLERLDLAFGPGVEPTLAQDGIHVHGVLRTLPLGDWAALTKGAGLGRSPLPISFDVRVESLRTLGQEFDNVQLRGARGAVAWQVALESERAAGTITVPSDLAQVPLTLDLDRLWLRAVASDNTKRPLDPRALPNLVLACASFRYEAVDLGQASLATARTGDGLQLQSLVFHSPAFQVRADGHWRLRDGAHASQFSIELDGEKLGDILQTFGYDAQAIAGGRTQLDIEASWPGTPGEFTLDRLDGSIGMHVRKGRFLAIEPGGGRLFGLLSLQTLPRRLSFDFEDLFQKGYAFDRIEGRFELENGNAYTNSLYMEGPSARVEVTGRTGLATQDYDQRATVTPALSKSIPLASALFGPAGIGVGAAIYLGQKFFKDIPEQVDRVLRKQYAITGSWAEPKIEKL